MQDLQEDDINNYLEKEHGKFVMYDPMFDTLKMPAIRTGCNDRKTLLIPEDTAKREAIKLENTTPSAPRGNRIGWVLFSLLVALVVADIIIIVVHTIIAAAHGVQP